MCMRITLGVISFLLVWCIQNVFAENWRIVDQEQEIFQTGYVQAIGTSAYNQNKIAALRAATVIAQRNLLEIIQGINLTGGTTIQCGMVASDEIRSRVTGMLKGATKCGQRYHEQGGYAEVCMRILVNGQRGLYKALLPALQNAQWALPQENSSPTLEMVSYRDDSRENIPPQKKHDGLIMDVRSLKFKPALINRIMSEKNSILFEPSMVTSDILVERGCGGFTNSLDKAKALLSSWGCNEPMVALAQDLVKGTDVKIDSQTASLIDQCNAKTNFLAQAKVVFVLN